MTPLQNIDTIVFDILGTLVDHTAGIRHALSKLVTDPAKVDDLVVIWEDHLSVEHQKVIDRERAYVSAETLDREAAQAVLDAAGITSTSAVDGLACAAKQLPGWPDSAEALARLSTKYELIGLSNADASSLLRINSTTDLRWHMALSTELAGTFKPDRPAYQLAIDAARKPANRILMVAAHAWDLRGAQRAGLRTAYLARPTSSPPEPHDNFDIRLSAISQLFTGSSHLRV